MDSAPKSTQIDGEEVDLELEIVKESRAKSVNNEKGKKTGHIYKACKNFKRRRKLTSGVWVNFTILEPDPDGNLWCKCKKCGQIYSADSKYGTGNLLRHSSSCKKKMSRDVGQMLLQSSSDGLKTRNPTFNTDVFREMLVVAIVKHGLPFQFAEYEGIRNVFSYLQPDVKLFSRNTTKNDIIKLYNIEKVKLAAALHEVSGRISLTSDCWSSLTTDGYISLTAHYVDASWTLQKRILNFSFIPPPHTGVAMSEKIYTLLKDWGIEKKIMSMTLDNASANDVFVDCLKGNLDLVCDGMYFHIRYCCHILNLVVQEGLKEVDEAVCKVRETVKYCKGSQARKQRFLDCVAYVSLSSSRGLRQDVPTRWNSTFMMLESAIFYRKAFVHLQKNDTNYVHCPTNDEWSRVEKIFKFLKVFYDVTCAFSGSKYPTANLYFPNVMKVRLLLKDEMESADSFVRKMALRMWGKFEKYWSDFSPIMAIAAIMDPRYKFQLVSFSYTKVYGSNASFEVSCLKEKLFELFGAYVSSSTHSNGGRSISSKSSGVNVGAPDGFMEDFDDFSGGEFASTPKSELELYLEEPLIPRVNELDILDYWKSCQLRFPIVSLMARDLLCMPISTVASESAFSIGGRVLDPVRSSLKPSIVEALICLRDWLYGQQADDAVGVEDICHDIMNLKIDIDNSSCPSSSPSPISASGSGSTPCSSSKPAVNVLD